jgi:hypothetical protein
MSVPFVKMFGSYTLLVNPNCHQASWEPLSRSYTYAEALILANTVLVRAEANGLHQKRVRAKHFGNPQSGHYIDDQFGQELFPGTATHLIYQLHPCNKHRCASMAHPKNGIASLSAFALEQQHASGFQIFAAKKAGVSALA